MEKKALRIQAKRTRNSLPEEERCSSSKGISSHLLSLLKHGDLVSGRGPAESLVVTSYVAFGSEVDLSDFNRTLLEQGGRLLLPRTTGCPFGVMEFVEVLDLDDDDSFVTSSYGIREPTAPAVSDQLMVDLVLLPGLLFDRAHFRLGYGGGYYDRYLAQRNMIQTRRPLYVGVAYSAQIVDTLPADTHDLRVDHIVTESGLDAYPSAC